MKLSTYDEFDVDFDINGSPQLFGFTVESMEFRPEKPDRPKPRLKFMGIRPA
jgi:hypothetical protein